MGGINGGRHGEGGGGRETTELKTNVISAAAEKKYVFRLMKLIWQPVPEGGCSICGMTLLLNIFVFMA